jgi:hypothetical protein
MNTGIPSDFGGFVGAWQDGRALLVRYGKGRPVEALTMTPLNLLQAHKTLGALIDQGQREGHITAEHQRQSEQLPHAQGVENLPPRERVDDVAGPD